MTLTLTLNTPTLEPAGFGGYGYGRSRGKGIEGRGILKGTPGYEHTNTHSLCLLWFALCLSHLLWDLLRTIKCKTLIRTDKNKQTLYYSVQTGTSLQTVC